MEENIVEKIIRWIKNHKVISVIGALIIIAAFANLKEKEPRNIKKEVANQFEAIYDSKDITELDSAWAGLIRLQNEIKQGDPLRARIDSMISAKQNVYEVREFQWEVVRKYEMVQTAMADMRRTIKANMNNPDSFEHVSDDYTDKKGGGYYIYETCRGTNGYGAIITSTYRGVLSESGVLSNIKQID